MSEQWSDQLLLQRGRAYRPHGAISAFDRWPSDLAFVTEGGQGTKLHHSCGRQYLDYVSSAGGMLISHAHPHPTHISRQKDFRKGLLRQGRDG